MSIKNNFYKLSSTEFNNYLNELKKQTNTFHFLNHTNKPYFYYQTPEINSLILNLNKVQWEFDTLIDSFSSFAKKQIIQSFLLSEIDATNKIEQIYSTRHDIFSIMNQIKVKSNKKIISVVNSYNLLLNSHGQSINSLKDIRNVYDQLLANSIEKNDIPNGTFFRKQPVYISNGINNIHNGINDEENINKAMEEFITIYNSSLNIYEKMIIAHFLIETNHPYYDGNGRLGRYLFSNGTYLSTNSLVSFVLSSAFATYKTKYYKAFKNASDKHKFGCLNIFVEDISSLLLTFINDTIKELQEKKNKIIKLQKPINMTKSEKRIYSLIAEASILSSFGINNEEIITELNISKRTLMYTLNHFKELEIIEDTKFGKFTYHKIKNI